MNLEDEIQVEFIRFGINVQLSDIEIESSRLGATEQMIARVRFTLASREMWIEPQWIAKHPASWWDAFKERWFPDWLQRHFPLSYTRIYHDVKHYHLYPKMAIPESRSDPLICWMKDEDGEAARTCGRWPPGKNFEMDYEAERERRKKAAEAVSGAEEEAPGQ